MPPLALLAVLHAADVVGEGGALLAAVVRRVVAQQLGDLEAVGLVFVDSELDTAVGRNPAAVNIS